MFPFSKERLHPAVIISNDETCQNPNVEDDKRLTVFRQLMCLRAVLRIENWELKILNYFQFTILNPGST